MTSTRGYLCCLVVLAVLRGAPVPMRCAPHEAGQLTFVWAVLLTLGGLTRVAPESAHRVARLSPCVIGSLASSWCIERAVRIF